MTLTYNAYANAINKMMMDQIDPYNFTGYREEK